MWFGLFAKVTVMSDAAQAPAPAPAAAANPNKLIFIMMGAMFFLLVVGMAGMFFAIKGKSSDHAAETTSDSAKNATKDKAKDDAKEKSPAKYVSFEPPFVVNFKAESAVKFLQVSLQVMTRDSSMERVLKENEPAVRNTVLALLDGQTYEVLSTAEGKDDLRKSALEHIREVMKSEGADPEKVEAVYFTSFVMQ
jgi:flagellar FliL protein